MAKIGIFSHITIPYFVFLFFLKLTKYQTPLLNFYICVSLRLYMEKKSKSILSFLLPYAIGILVVRLIIDTIIKQFNLGYQGESYGGFIALVIELALIFITIRNFKKYANNGNLKFSEGVRVGVGLLLIVGILFTTYLTLHGKFIDPTYQEKLTQEAAEMLTAKDPNADVSPLTNSKPNLMVGFFMSLLKYIFIGAFGGIVCTAILKTER